MSLLSFKGEHRKSFRLSRKSKMKEKQTLLMSSNAKHRFWSIFQLIIEFSVKNYVFPDFRKHLSGMIKYSGFLLRNLKSKEMRFLLLVFFRNNLFFIPQISFMVFALFYTLKIPKMVLFSYLHLSVPCCFFRNFNQHCRIESWKILILLDIWGPIDLKNLSSFEESPLPKFIFMSAPHLYPSVMETMR